MAMRKTPAVSLALLLTACGFRFELGSSTDDGTWKREASIPVSDSAVASPTDAAIPLDASSPADARSDAALSKTPGQTYASASQAYFLRCSTYVVNDAEARGIAARVNFQYSRSLSSSDYASSLAECSAWLAGGSCGNSTPACDFDGVLGAAPTGSQCEFASECQSGTCTGSADSCGLCAATPAPGDVCNGSAGSCGPHAGCLAGKCVVRTYVAEGGSCSDLGTVCDESLVCASGTNTCISPRAVGEACASDDDCDQGATVACAANRCVRRPGLGQACNSTLACGPGLACDATSSVCRAPRMGLAVGALCDQVDGCTSGAACVYMAGNSKCVALAADGARCAADTECESLNAVCGRDKICGIIGTHCDR